MSTNLPDAGAPPARAGLALSLPCILGEGVQWHGASGRWWWTDIESSSVYAWSGDGGPAQSFRLPDRVGSFAHCRSGRVLLGLAKRLGFADLPLAAEAGTPWTAQVETVVPVDPAESRTRINDGRCDREGNFVFGTINEARDPRPIGSFYQYSTQHGLRRLALPAVAIANSVCFSLDGRTMYFTDTLTRQIWQCDYEAGEARVENPRLFAEVVETNAYPDGSVIDRDGCLWNAQWGAARVVQYEPDGRLRRVIEVPVKNPSCPALGGEQGDVLMITTSRKDMRPAERTAMPEAGSLFGVHLERPLAVAEVIFEDDPVQGHPMNGAAGS